MGSKIILFLLVGLVYSTTNPGWKKNSEYNYKVNGRSLANLDESFGHHTGILFKAYLRIQPRSNGTFYCLIEEPKYTQVHSKLDNGWDSEIPESYLSWKPLALSKQPFQVEMENGVITDLIVSKYVSNWEGNIIKGLMSQFQLQLNDRLYRSSPDSITFTTMEDTVSGDTETLYQMRPLQKHVLQNNEDESRYIDLIGNEYVIEVIKHKNYSNYVELPSYFHGFGDMVPSVATNKMGNFAIRDTTSRAILTGNLNQYTIQSSTTVNKVFISPTFSDERMGSVISSMNVVLESVKPEIEKIAETPQPVRLGNLVYTYSKPYDLSNRVREKTLYHKIMQQELRPINNFYNLRMVPSPVYKSYKLEKPSMNEAPGSPFLQFTTGFKGKSIKEEIDIVKNVKILAEKISRDLQDSEYFDHEKVLDRSSTLISLIRVMDFEELQTVLSELYNTSEQSPKYSVWSTFLDALATSGTGPAFLCIQSLIETEKLQVEQASDFISAMANSVREPTLEYMRAFFELIKKPQVLSYWPLNNTALLTYTHLIRRVYVDVRYSNSQYPVNSFGAFWNEGEQLVKEEVIPYLTKQLNKYISQGDTSKIHVYICALGNIAAPEILTAYEPYLEGRKQASQFQRLMMILSMADLTQVHQKNAALVLFKVYQNPGETEEVRMAAVYLLMNCNPSTEILMIMASYTNRDLQERVNAAVKSSIEHAAELEGVEFYQLRSSARAARPLLTKKTYGFEYGANYLRSYFIETLKVWFKESAAFWGSEDEYLPKGIRYTLSGVLGDRKRDINMQAYVSSLKELFHVGSQQLESYQRYQKQQMEHSDDQQRFPWSSQNINKLFNIKATEREQLEGLLYSKLCSVYGMYSFDNHTIERFPQAVRELEEKLEKGVTINKLKMFNSQEMTLSFPTELGMPFIFTYETPTIIKAQGQIVAVSSPKLSQYGQISTPETVQVNSNIKIAVATKVQSRLTLTTPFDNKQYIAGFDKHLEFNIPFCGKVDIDVKNKSIRAEIEQRNTQKRTDFFRYKTWPYTSKSDIKDFEPLSSQTQTMIMKRGESPKIETTFGKETTGMAFHVELEHERNYRDIFSLDFLLTKNILPLELLNDNSIQYMQIGAAYLPQKSFTNRAVFRFQYQTQYKSEDEAVTFTKLKIDENEEPFRRQHKIIEKVSAGIKSVYAQSVDASVDFQGINNVKYVLTGAYGKSNVDPKSRVMIFFKTSSDGENMRPYEMSFVSKSYIPNTSELDMYYALENVPISETQMELEFGQYRKNLSKIDMNLKYNRSEERKQYLEQLSTYHQCKQEMCDGNKQLSACLNMTMISNLMDNVSMKVRYENLGIKIEKTFAIIFLALRLISAPSLYASRKESILEPNEIMMQARFHPDLKYFDISLQTRDQELNVSNIWVCPFVRKTFVSHPVIHVGSRWTPYRFSYRPVCVVDQTKIYTFSNLTYPATISKQWTVMLQYIPKEARHYENQTVEEQLRYQIKNYVVLVKENFESSKNKDLKIILSSDRTEFKPMAIELTPNQRQGPLEPKAIVTVDGQKIKISNEKSHDVRNSIQIYSLPYGEVKVEIRNAFHIIYDGERVKLTVTNYKFKDSIRGLCGQFSGRWDDDFITPANCFARDPKKFVKSYEVEGQEGQKIRMQFAQRTNHCLEKRFPLYADVIDNHDANRTIPHDHHVPAKCTTFQTKIVEHNGETCFTIHALPTCSSHCKSSGYLTKPVSVHCPQKSDVVELWKSQIDQGSSPDLSEKEKHKSIPITVPQSCYE